MAVIRYGDHRVYLKSITGGMLCIVVAGPVNMPALRMAANLVGRRISPAVARAQADLPAPVVEEAPRPLARAPVSPHPGRRNARLPWDAEVPGPLGRVADRSVSAIGARIER